MGQRWCRPSDNRRWNFDGRRVGTDGKRVAFDGRREAIDGTVVTSDGGYVAKNDTDIDTDGKCVAIDDSRAPRDVRTAQLSRNHGASDEGFIGSLAIRRVGYGKIHPLGVCPHSSPSSHVIDAWVLPA